MYAGNYKDSIFDHWNNGNKGRIRTLTISEARTITAYYKMEPQNVKVEFAYKDCGLFAAGYGVGTITCADGTTTDTRIDTACVWLHGEQEPCQPYAWNLEDGHTRSGRTILRIWNPERPFI